MKLEQLQNNASIRGIIPDALVTVVNVQWYGSEALELTYKTPAGKVANELLYRHDEPRLEIVEQGRPWSFDGDGALFRLVSEAQRIRLAHLFDPVLAVHTSVVDPLPHQITAVYEAMLPRQPLRFLLADDPGAGKTIMAGLLIKELIARGDLQRCLIVCPGSLAEQWQDELYRRFHLPFDILTNDKLEAARTGNWFLENNLVIARLDKLSRNESVQQKLQAPDCRWDLVVCDEAHKMSATVFGGETKYTQRYRLGQLLSTLIGPGMAVYTRYSKVLDAEGKPIPVRAALALINQTLDEALAEQEGDFDADTRWALTWFEQSGFAAGEYGVAEQLSKSKNTAVAGLVETGILVSKGGKVRLLAPDELPDDWDPTTDERLTVWEMVHQLIRALNEGSEPAAAALVAKLGSKAETARELCYRLYTLCERKKRATEAIAYNALVQSWPEITRLASDSSKPAPVPPAQAGLL